MLLVITTKLTRYKLSLYILLTFLALTITVGCTSKKNKIGRLAYGDGTPGFNKVIDRATQLQDSGFTTKALIFLDSNFRYQHPTNVLDIFHYYYFCFDHYNNHAGIRNTTKAGAYADSMIALLEAKDATKAYAKQYAQAIFSKGDALFYAGKYPEAYKFFYQAKTLIKNDIDPCTLLDYSFRLGMVLYRQERFSEAAYYFEEAFTESSSCDFDFTIFYRRQQLIDNIGLSFAKCGVTDSALFYYDSALSYIRNNFYKFPSRSPVFRDKANAVVYGNKGVVYGNIGKYQEAIELIKKSILINEQKGFDPIDAQLNRLRLADIYYKLRKISDLQSTLQLTQKINDTLPDKNVQLGLYNMLWKYYDLKNDVNNAFVYLQKYHDMKDSIDIQMRAFKETDLNEKVKNLDKQYEITTLEKNNEIKKIYLIISFLGAIMSAIIFLLVFNNWQKSRRNVKALTYLHDQVSIQKVELEKLLKKLEETHRDKDRVLRAVAHDIRNPLAAISSLADLLLADEYVYEEEQREFLSYIKNSCTDALSLTREILEAADPSKADTLEKEQVDIKKIFTDYIELLRYKASEKNQQINLSLPSHTVEANVNREKMWRVISNLVTNAIKFSPDDATINIDLEQHNGQIHISVSDEGIGIPDNLKDKIFDMFTEAKRPGTSGERPFGLGLSISKHIVDIHNGKIWFENNGEKGSVFHVTIPVA